MNNEYYEALVRSGYPTEMAKRIADDMNAVLEMAKEQQEAK